MDNLLLILSLLLESFINLYCHLHVACGIKENCHINKVNLHFLWWHCDPKPPYEKSMTTKTITFLPCWSVHTTYCQGQTLQMLIKSRMVFCPITNNKKNTLPKILKGFEKQCLVPKITCCFFTSWILLN